MKKIIIIDGGPRATFNTASMLKKFAEGVGSVSNEIEVIKVVSSIEAPVATAATGVTETGFTANWKSVPEAELYKLNVYKNTRIKETGLTTLLDEDFSGVTQGTFTSVEFGKLQEYLDDYTHQSGWYGVNHVFAAGTIGLAPYGDAASLTTPYLDLSNDEGKVQATINMDAQLFGALPTPCRCNSSTPRTRCSKR